MEGQYGYKKKMDCNFHQAVQKSRQELANEGFGVLTEIDVKDTLKKKLDVDFDEYIILGACNPGLAHRALQTEQDIGLLLPCNVIVYRRGGATYVSAIKPITALGIVKNPALEDIAREVEEKIMRAIDRC